jgi:predicted dinucleotide-binding enzyme
MPEVPPAFSPTDGSTAAGPERPGEERANVTDERPVIGIFGAGKVGTALARLLVSAGYEVLLSGSPRQTALDLLVSVVAPGARVATADRLVEESDVIIVAVPFGKAASVPWATFDGKIVVDATNYWPPIDGTIQAVDDDPRTTSEIHAALNPRARVVKSLNHLGYHEMEDDSMPPGSPLRRALAVVGDDAGARRVVARLIDDLGFDAVDGGPLVNGCALEPGHPAFGRELSAAELAALMADERVLVA